MGTRFVLKVKAPKGLPRRRTGRYVEQGILMGNAEIARKARFLLED